MDCPACRHPLKPRARFCTCCGQALGECCAQCGAPRDADDRYCRACGTALAASGTAPGAASGARVRTTGARRAGRTAAVSGAEPATDTVQDERRRVTVLFADVSGFTAMSEALDPEEVKDIMDGCFAMLSEAITAEGGTVDKYIGDCIMALFGAPVAHEDDPDRAVRAALQMQRLLAEATAVRSAPVRASERPPDGGAANQDGARPHAKVPLRLRIGLNTGKVLAGLLGSRRAGDYTVMGDTVNLASRLESAAPIGGILISQSTREALGDRFHLERVAPLTVKGKTGLIEAWLVRGARTDFALAEPERSAFVGRARWLAALDAAYEQAAAGRMQARLLIGSAGVGKSRLGREWVRTLARREPAPLVLVARFLPEGEDEPLRPLGAMFARLFVPAAAGDAPAASAPGGAAALAGQPPVAPAGGDEHDHAAARAGARRRLDEELSDALDGDQRALLARLCGLGAPDDDAPAGEAAGEADRLAALAERDPQQYADRLFQAVVALLRQLASRQPVVLLFGDVHDAPALARAFFAYLFRTLETARVCVLLTARPRLQDEYGDWRAAQQALADLTLEPLSADEAGQLLDERARPATLAPAARDALVRRAEGNPLFLEELFAAACDAEVLCRADGEWRLARPDQALPLPGRIEGVLQARLDRLDPAARDLLRLAAVAGSATWREFLESAFGPEADAALAVLVALGFLHRRRQSSLRDTAEYAFHAMLVQQVAYENMPKRLRQERHLALARWLEDRSDEDRHARLAFHYERGGEPARAVPALRVLATRRFDAETMRRACEQLLRLAPDEDTQRLAHRNLADLLYRRGALDEAEHHAERLRALAETAGDQGDGAHAAVQLARVLESRGDQGAALARLDRGLAPAGVPARARSALLVARAWTLLALARHEDAATAAGAALDAAPARDDDARGRAHAALGAVAYHRARLPEAADHFLEARRACEASGDLVQVGRALGNLSAVYLHLRDFTRAQDYAAQSLALGERAGDLESVAISHFNLAGIAQDAGRLDRALAALDEAAAWFARLAHEQAQAQCRVVRAALLLDLGRHDDADAAAQDARQRFEALRTPGMAAYARLVLAHRLLLDGRSARAVLAPVAAHQADLPRAEDRHLRHRLRLADALRRGAGTAARTLLDEARAALAAEPDAAAGGALELLAGQRALQANRIDEAESCWTAVREAAQREGRERLHVQVSLRLAVAAQLRGDAARAAAYVADARRAAAALAALIEAPDLRGEFLAAPALRGLWSPRLAALAALDGAR